MVDEFLWVEKYRPKTVGDCILPENLNRNLGHFIETQNLQHLLFHGGPGIGKTTTAMALCNDLDMEYLFINASNENGIDVIRTKFMEYASTHSLNGRHKVIILDEADYLTSFAQSALRSFFEEFSANCKFIFTCNYVEKIIKPLRDSRMIMVDFAIPKAEENSIKRKTFKRAISILEKENVKFEPEVLANALKKFYPDIRKFINELQYNSVDGELKLSILGNGRNNTEDLIDELRKNDFNGLRTWAADNYDKNHTELVKEIYQALTNSSLKLNPSALVLILAEYIDKLSRSSNPEITLTAMLVEIGDLLNG